MADVGAGAGYHSIRLARRVGAKGTVYATDVQPEMLRMLRTNAREAGVTNIKPLRCTQEDPRLPKEAVDLILMVDVYHECSDPELTLKGLRAALKPGGRLVLVEFRGEDPEVPIKPEHKMTLGTGPPRARAPGLHLQGVARVPPLAAHHHLRETRRESEEGRGWRQDRSGRQAGITRRSEIGPLSHTQGRGSAVSRVYERVR